MKKLSLLFLSAMVLLSSCDKDDDEKQISISNEEAASLIAGTLGSDETGLITIFGDALVVLEEVTAGNTGGKVNSCGASDHTTFNYASAQGETPAYAFNYDYGWTLTCSNSQPSLLEISMSYDGNIESPDLTMIYDGGSELSVTNIMEEVVTFNGAHNQDATYNISNEGQQYSGTHKFLYTLTGINVAKATKTIQSGTAAVQLTGSTNEGVYSVTASITYHGDGTATVTVNGQAFGVDLSSGMIDG